MQETNNTPEYTDLNLIPPRGRILALDPGTKRVGIAVCDERQIISRPVEIVERSSWKKLLKKIESLLSDFDAVALVVGLPYNFDGSESEMSAKARDLARKFRLSLPVPVFLQDERATSYEARGRLWSTGDRKRDRFADAEAASIILTDFLDRLKAARAH